MNKKEQRIEELRQEYEKKNKENEVKKNRIRKKIIKADKLRNELGDIMTHLLNIQNSLHYEYSEKIQKLCDHKKYPVSKRMNMRDDASFTYWLYCSNCKADLGTED